MINIILRAQTHTSEWCTADFAVVQMSPKAAQWYMKRLLAAKLIAVHGFYCVSYFTHDVAWYQWDDAIGEMMEGHEVMVMPDASCHSPRVEQTATTARIMPDGIMWHSVIRRSDPPIHMETARLPKEILEELAIEKEAS